MAAVLTREPDFAALPAMLPPRLVALLRRALAKKPRERWQASGDLRFELEAIRAHPEPPAAPPPRRRWTPVVIAAAVAAAIAASLALWLRPSPPPPAPVHLALDLPAGQSITTWLAPVAVSPDGETIAYASSAGVYLRRLCDDSAQLVPDSVPSDGSPAFSPDGRWLAYYSDAAAKLVKVSLATGLTVPLAAVDPPRGIAWDQPGQILLGEGAAGIVAVPASGGAPRTFLATPGFAASPQLLPGDQVLYTLSPASLPFSLNNTEAVMQPPHGGAPRVLAHAAISAHYVAGRGRGVLLYVSGSQLMQARFDAASGRMGTPSPVASRVRVTSDNYPPLADFAAVAGGPLVTVAGGTQTAPARLEIRSRDGQSKTLDWPAPGSYYDPATSPNGRQVAAEMLLPSPAESVVVAPLDGSASMRRLTFSSGLIPIWSPDGRDLAFGSTRRGATGLWVQPADGSAPPRHLSTAPGSEVTAPDSWSPDGRWFAYFSDETGEDQVWVQPFPPTGAKYEVTSAGGSAPRWSRDGKQLYFLAGPAPQSAVLSVVDIQLSPSFAARPPLALPKLCAGWQISGEHPFDLLPNGAFIASVPGPTATASRIHVILHWLAAAG